MNGKLSTISWWRNIALLFSLDFKKLPYIVQTCTDSDYFSKAIDVEFFSEGGGMKFKGEVQ